MDNEKQATKAEILNAILNKILNSLSNGTLEEVETLSKVYQRIAFLGEN